MLNPASDHRHPQGDGASQWIQHDAERPDRHLPGSDWSGSDAADQLLMHLTLKFYSLVASLSGNTTAFP